MDDVNDDEDEEDEAEEVAAVVAVPEDDDVVVEATAKPKPCPPKEAADPTVVELLLLSINKPQAPIDRACSVR